MTGSQAKRWCFTINNYTEDDEQHLFDFSETEGCVTLVYGREIAPGTGTPHLQGLVILSAPKRLAQLRNINAFARAHLEVMRGTIQRAYAYCIKDGDFESYGEPITESVQGRRTDLDEILAWLDTFIAENNRAPTSREIAVHQPRAFLRYRNFPLLATMRAPTPVLRVGEPNDWQRELMDELNIECDNDREIRFYVDEDGGKGKTWFMQWYKTQNPDRVQILGTGSYIDLAYAIDVSHDVFIFNVPRGGMEYFCYRIAESLKDKVIFSTKYECVTKYLAKIPHVVVFSNEHPDMDKLSNDRYNIQIL